MKKTISILAMAAVLMSMTACNDTKINSDSPDSEGISLDSDSKDDTPDGDSGSSEEIPDNSSDGTSDEKPSGNNANEHEGEMSGSVFVLDDGRAIDLYGGGYERGKNYANSLNQIKANVGDQVNVFSLVAPTAVSFYLPEKYASWSGSEWDNIENINYYLDGVIPVDVYSVLEQHVNEDIYLRTDHHWAPLGAFYAAEEFAKTALTDFAPLSDYTVESRDGYIGTMYGFSDYDVRIKNNPETFTVYIPQNDYSTEHYDADMTNGQPSYLFDKLQAVDLSQCYLVFHVDDGGITHVTTDKKNNRKLMVIKDSYANALVPCLTNSFEEIWAVDMRTFQLSISQFVKDHGITDVLFCMNTFSATGDNQYKIAGIL